jgi:NAD(P)-dependent dehydrogenase (short-subunit alcohol dehydrogenase family)
MRFTKRNGPGRGPPRAMLEEARMGDFEGQVAIVTGAAVGLGRQYALRLAAQGCDVVVCDIRQDVRDVAEALRRSGVGCEAHVADVSNPDDVKRVVDAAIRRFGRIDLLIANAGIWRGGGPKDDLDKSLADYEALIGTNLKGVYLFGRAVIPHMIAAGGGHIINIATDHIHTHPGRRTSGGAVMDLYDVAKWGVLGLTLTWAKALRPHDIRVNSFSMGATDSHMLRGFHNHAASAQEVASWMRAEDVCDLAIQLHREGPGGRTGENIGVWVGFEIELKPVPAPKPALVEA